MTTLGDLTDQQLTNEVLLLDDKLLALKQSRVEVTYLNVRATEESKSPVEKTGKAVAILGAFVSGVGGMVVISTPAAEIMASTAALIGAGASVAGAVLVVPAVVLAMMKKKRGSLIKRRDRELEEQIRRLTIYRISCREILHRRAIGILHGNLDDVPVSDELPPPRP